MDVFKVGNTTCGETLLGGNANVYILIVEPWSFPSVNIKQQP
jgi:hypothetical protein